MASPKNEDRITVEYMPLSKLLRAPRNPKEHDLGAVHESIDRFGFVNPIIMNEKTGRLVAGHGRLDTLQQQKASGRKPPTRIFEKDGEWMVPVVRGVAFADDMEAEAYVVADNRTVELGGWNEEALVAILSDHAASDRGLKAIGYDQNDIDKMLRRMGQAAPETIPQIKSTFLIIVTCNNEIEQRELLEKLVQEGRQVRAAIS